MRCGFLAILVASVGCKKTPDAPRDLDQLARDVYAHYDDPIALAADVVDLLPLVSGGVDTEEAKKGYTLTDLDAGAVDDVERPDRDLALLIGAAVLGHTAFPPMDHAQATLEPLQVWNEPNTYNQYDREIVGGDAAAYEAGSGRIDTENTIEKSGAFGVTIPYTLLKDFQWVATPEGDAVVARSWVADSGCSENGKNCVMSSFSLEFYYPDPDSGNGLRMTATWIDLVTEADAFLTEEGSLDLLVNGIYDIFENTDAHIAGTLEY